MLWLLSAFIVGENMTGSTLFNMVNFHLKNGLEVIFLKNKSAPTASVGVLYKYGSADDDPKTYGIAHFLEHMMFKGTKQYPKGQLDEIIMRLGGRTTLIHHGIKHFITRPFLRMLFGCYLH